MKHNSIHISDETIHLCAGGTRGQSGARIHESIPARGEGVLEATRSFIRKNNLHGQPVMVCLPRTQVSFRYLTLPTSDDREIKQMVDYEMGHLFPFKPEELVYDFAVLQKNDRGYSKLLLTAVQRELLSRHLALVAEAGAFPEKVSVSTVLIFNKFIARHLDKARYVVAYLDGASMEILAIADQKLIFSRAVPARGARRTGDGFAREFTTTLAVLADRGFSPEQIVLAGMDADLKAASETLRNTSPCPVSVDETFDIRDGKLNPPGMPDLSINLMPADVRRSETRKLRAKTLFYTASLICINAALISSIVGLKVKYRQNYLNIVRADIRRITISTAELKKKIAAVQVLKTYRNAGKSTLAVLSDVYRFAPADMRLVSLDITNKFDTGTLVLTGRAPDSGVVLSYATNLKTSQLIKTADVTNIKKLAAADEKPAVDFELKATY